MINKVILLGRLGKDPEIRTTSTGKKVATISLATSESTGSGPDRKEKTEWHKIILWNKTAEIAGRFLRKGSRVAIEGKIAYRDYMDKENIKRFVTEITADRLTLIDGIKQNAENDQAADRGLADLEDPAPGMAPSDDEVPF